MNSFRIKKRFIALAVFALGYALLYGYRLGIPGEPYFDEIYFVEVAHNILRLSGSIGEAHPPFAKYLIALCIAVLGDYPWVWRLPSFVSGFGILTLTYLLTKQLTQSTRAAFFATFILAFDCVSFTLARIALLNDVMLFMMLLALYLLIRYLSNPVVPRKTALIWIGIATGLAIGTRWVALSLIPLYGFLLLLKKPGDSRILPRTLFFYMILPALGVYVLLFLYIPFMQGYDWSAPWRFQPGMLSYHITLNEHHPLISRWWTWPLMIKPMWFYIQKASYVSLLAHNNVNSVFCFGNPGVFWLWIPIFFFAVWEWLRRKTFICAFAVVGYLSQWLPWAALARDQWFHFIHSAMPFAAMGIGYTLNYLWCQHSKMRWAVLVYLILVLALFVYFYPLMTAMKVDMGAFMRHMWFKTWLPHQ